MSIGLPEVVSDCQCEAGVSSVDLPSRSHWQGQFRFPLDIHLTGCYYISRKPVA